MTRHLHAKHETSASQLEKSKGETSTRRGQPMNCTDGAQHGLRLNQSWSSSFSWFRRICKSLGKLKLGLQRRKSSRPAGMLRYCSAAGAAVLAAATREIPSSKIPPGKNFTQPRSAGYAPEQNMLRLVAVNDAMKLLNLLVIAGL
jgi:hypothetical protein